MSGFTWPPDREAAAQLGIQSGPEIPAAVLVPLFVPGDGADPHLVLTRRRADLRRHAGEISFPGGRSDEEDADLATTALREAEEEIGLRRAVVQLIGQLPTVSTFATNYVIHPFVGILPAGLGWRVSAREVDEVIELPLQTVRESRTRTVMKRRGITFETDAYIIGEHLIWGATARIIELLLARLREPGPAGELALQDAAP